MINDYLKCPTCISFAIFGEDMSMTTRRCGPHRGGRTPFCSNSEIWCETKSFFRQMLMNPAPANSNCTTSHINQCSTNAAAATHFNHL